MLTIIIIIQLRKALRQEPSVRTIRKNIIFASIISTVFVIVISIGISIIGDKDSDTKNQIIRV